MSQKSKYLIKFAAVVIIGILFLFVDYKENEVELTLHYNNDIVKIKVLESQYKDFKIKSDLNILYFDGEYFFEQPPISKNCNAKIVNTKLIEHPSVSINIIIYWLIIISIILI